MKLIQSRGVLKKINYKYLLSLKMARGGRSEPSQCDVRVVIKSEEEIEWEEM